MQTLEKELDQLQLQQQVKKIILNHSCILQEQGAALFASLYAEKMKGHTVTLDFKAVQHYSPAFFDGLFLKAVAEDFKKINVENISPLGRKLLFWVMGAHYDKPHRVESLYQVYVTKTDKFYPVLYVTNGIVTIMTESGVAEWLEHNGTVQGVEVGLYEQLMTEKTKAHIEYRERQSAASRPLECPKCHQSYHGSINGFRKHVFYCRKGNWQAKYAD